MGKINYLSSLTKKIEKKSEYLNGLLLVEPLSSEKVNELSVELDKLITEYYRLILFLSKHS